MKPEEPLQAKRRRKVRERRRRRRRVKRYRKSDYWANMYRLVIKKG
jgi:hypothetical protein